MSRKKEEPQGTSSVSFRVPDFVGEDGVEYTDIEVIVEMTLIFEMPPTLRIHCSSQSRT